MATWTDCDTVERIQDGQCFCLCRSRGELKEELGSVCLLVYISRFAMHAAHENDSVLKHVPYSIRVSLEHVGHQSAL